MVSQTFQDGINLLVIFKKIMCISKTHARFQVTVSFATTGI